MKSQAKVPIGVAFGRFQPFHLGHLQYLKLVAESCQFLVVGITNPGRDLERPHESSPHRAKEKANPLSFYERARLISLTLPQEGVGEGDFMVVPFPLEKPERIRQYAPVDATYYLPVFDDWGREKLRVLNELNLRVIVLDIAMQYHGSVKYQATDVRARIARGDASWKSFVPPAVADYLESHQLIEKIRQPS